MSGDYLQDYGQQQVLATASACWKAAFAAEAEILAARAMPFTSEDITARCGQPPEDTHPSAVGAMMSGVAKQHGLRVLRYVKAQRPQSHAARLALWQKPI